ncbi:MAG: hypothetical protein IJI21_02700 [Clostridia bacterium]|nr:hypothetical protein [Clostridia bacterium]
MYCVQCGVRLQEGAERCPLCRTPVWNPGEVAGEASYPDQLPPHYRESSRALAIALTVISVMSIAVILIICFRLYGWLKWGGYAIGAILLFDVVAVLPLWFSHPRAELLVPADHVAVALFLLFICVQTGGNWFLSFAFPLCGISCLLVTALLFLLKYVRGGKPYILGGFLLLLGGATVLIEFFEHITFGARMFRWSLYSLGVLALGGIFLLIAGMVPSLRQSMRRYFLY